MKIKDNQIQRIIILNWQINILKHKLSTLLKGKIFLFVQQNIN
jgi:hypothetical protein